MTARAAASLLARPVAADDLAAWRPLWDGYNAFYGREGETALAEVITQTTWQRFFDPHEPVHALVAESEGRLVGLAHYLFHRSMTRIEPVCYLSDLYTAPEQRGRGVGRALIDAVAARAGAAGATRLYWQTHETNAAGRVLYDAGDLAAAKTQLQWAVDHGDEEYAHLARVRLAGVLLDEKAYDQGLALLKDEPPAAFASLYADRRGDLLAAQDKRDDARAAYRKALDKLGEAEPATRQIIQFKLDALGAA